MSPHTSALDWLEQPNPSGISFLRSRERSQDWRCESQANLAKGARSAASTMISEGVGPNELILIALGTTPEFVHAFFGAVGAGATPTPVEPLGPLSNGQTYYERLGRIADRVNARFLICDDKHAELLSHADLGSRAPKVITTSALGRGDPDTELTYGGSSFLCQLTSGTTGLPKAIRFTPSQVSSHLAAIREWLDVTSDDIGVSWLPLHHDMGLIGHVLLPLCYGVQEYLMPQMSFVRRPWTWMETLSAKGGTITAAPTFGYRYLLDRSGGRDLAPTDLTRCKALVVGAERVDPAVLRRLVTTLGPYGLDPSAIRPAYGLAEATLAVAGSRLGSQPTYVQLEPRSTGLGKALDIAAEGLVLGGTELDDSVHVGCGDPIPGTAVTVVDPAGLPVPDGVLGEIVVEASWIGTVVDGCSSTSHRTGDAGFKHRGELFVVGRLGDSLSVRGLKVFAEHVEAAIMAEIGRHAVVVMGDDTDGPVVLSLVDESVVCGDVDQLHSIVRRHVDQRARSVLVAVNRSAVPRTSSGKPKRREIWTRYLEGSYAGQEQGVGRARND